MTKITYRCIVSGIFLSLLAATVAQGQIIPRAFSLSIGLGPSMYFGEFNSLQQKGTLSPEIGNDMEFGMKYTFNPYLGLQALFGKMRMPYGISDVARAKYSNSFFGPVGQAVYPASTILITPSNTVRVSRYQLMAEVYPIPSWKVAPVVSAGVAYINYSTTNGNDTLLPTNLTGQYKTGSVAFPLGVGVQITVSRDAWVFARLLAYVTTTDYLDGYGHYLDYEQPNVVPTGPGTQPTPNDYLASLTIGVGGVLFRTSPPDTFPPPPPVVERPPVREPPPPPPPAAVRTEFEGINFRLNSDDFDLSQPETAKNLRSLLNYLKSCDSLRVLVEGHTSSEGDPKRNRELSAQRARRIREWLLANGIDPKKILGTVGYGYALPKIKEPAPGTVTPEELEEIRKQNRRITVLVRKLCDQ